MPWRGMAIDAGAVGEDEIRQVAAAIEEQHRAEHERLMLERWLAEQRDADRQFRCEVDAALRKWNEAR